MGWLQDAWGGVQNVTNKVIGASPISQAVSSATGLSPEQQRILAGAALTAGAGAGALGAGGTTAGATGTAATTAGTAGAGTGGTLSSLLGAYGAADQFITDLPGTQQQGRATLAGLSDMYGQYQQGQAVKDTASQSQQLNMPWYNAGLSSLAKMQAGPSAYEESPYNKYLQESGAKQIQRSAAAKGMLGSGNLLAALSDYGQSTARQGYNDWWNQQGTLAGYGTNARSNLENANAFGNMGQAASNLGMLNAGGKMLANYW